MMKFNLWKFLVLLLTGFFLFSLPQIIKSFSVHDPITDRLEEPHQQIHNWQQSAIRKATRSVIALHTSQDRFNYARDRISYHSPPKLQNNLFRLS